MIFWVQLQPTCVLCSSVAKAVYSEPDFQNYLEFEGSYRWRFHISANYLEYVLIFLILVPHFDISRLCLAIYIKDYNS